jgi:hypothetical protein
LNCAKSLVAPVANKKCPSVIRRIILHVYEHGIDGVQFRVDGMLRIESRESDDDHFFAVDVSVSGVVVIIHIVVVKIVPPRARVVPVIHGFIRIELQFHG